MYKFSHLWLTIIVSIFGFFVVATASATNFDMWPQNGEMLGDYAAGAAAEADDSATAFYNPAGLTRIAHQDALFSIIQQSSNIRGDGSVTTSPLISGSTNNSGVAQGGDTYYFPTFLYAAPINNHWAFGFSLTTPYALNVNYGQGSWTRYAVVRNELQTLDIMPSLAFKLNNSFSFGLGANIQYLSMRFDHIATSTITSIESLSESDLSDWGFGFNLSALWNITASQRLGLTYRSPIKFRAGGYSSCNGRKFRDRSSFDLPSSTIISYYYEFSPTWAAMATVNYVQWSDLGDMRITNVAGVDSQYDVTLFQGLQNAWRFVLGVHYHPTQRWILRSGIGFEQSEASGSTLNLAFPATKQMLLAFGTGYQINEAFRIDVGYTHAFAPNENFSMTQTIGPRIVTTAGTISTSSDYLGAQIEWLMT